MIVDCAVYVDGRRRDGRLTPEQAREAVEEEGAFTWIALQEPDEQELGSLGARFDLPPLAVEDAVQAHQRPKLDVYGDAALLALKTVGWSSAEARLTFGELLVFLGRGYVISVRHGQAGSLDPVRHALEAHPERLRQGPAAVAHALVDRVVDDYAPVIAALEDEVGAVEEQVFSPARTNPAEQIYRRKRDVIDLYRAVVPLEEPLDRIVKGEIGMSRRVRAYFRDVSDHLAHHRERVESLRELLNSVLEVNLSRLTIRQNEDMRKISAWAAIAAVPTVIASIYGMNFRDMPELDSPIGYPVVLVVMVAISAGLYRWFRGIGWL